MQIGRALINNSQSGVCGVIRKLRMQVDTGVINL